MLLGKIWWWFSHRNPDNIKVCGEFKEAEHSKQNKKRNVEQTEK